MLTHLIASQTSNNKRTNKTRDGRPRVADSHQDPRISEIGQYDGSLKSSSLSTKAYNQTLSIHQI